jgi:hypothetical protein
MRRQIFKISLILSFAILVSCGSANVYVKPNTSFNRQMSLTITGTNNDDAGLIGELQNGLITNGFNVISENVAREGINISEKGQLNKNNFDINSQLYRSIELKSVYALNPKYRYNITEIGMRISNFQAELVDLFTGEVVMTINFSGSRTKSGVVKSVIDEINKQLK